MASKFAVPHCVGILLAAGLGQRWRAAHPDSNGTTHKLMAALPDGRPVAQGSASTLLAVLPETVAVVADDAPAVSGLLQRLGCTLVQAPAEPRGMGVSLAAAARHLLTRRAPDGRLPQCMVALADMPWLQPDTLRRVLHYAADDLIVVPVHAGRRGHPVVFGGAFLPELAEIGGDTGARDLLKRYGALEIECDDAGILLDIDTPQDLLTGNPTR